MAGSRRRNRRHWPDYLTARKKVGGLYYTWKHPQTGKEYGLGYDFDEAASQAREANLTLVAEQTTQARLVDRLSGADAHTMSAWIDEFEAILGRRTGKGGRARSANTLKTDKFRLKVLRAHFGNDLIAKVDTRRCADLIKSYQDKDQQRMAQSILSFMRDCFTEAEAAGWIPRGTNPATVAKSPAPQVKRSRLTLQQYLTTLASARRDADPWMETAMLLALLTGQRLSDISRMRFDDVRDGYLHVIQDKEGHPIRIPVALGLPAIGHTVESVIKQARRKGIVGAAEIVHHTVARTFAKAGDSVHENTISRGFTRALRNAYDEKAREREWLKNPPTFHEIRSLAKRLYDEIGVNTMTLLGHKTEEAAAIYRDPRGDWWTVPLPTKTG